MNSYIYSGVFVDSHNILHINKNRDKMNRDIILLNHDNSGSFEIDGVLYVYAYSYNDLCDNKTMKQSFRDHIKNPKSSEYELWNDFVEIGVLNISRYTDINKFSAIVRTKPSKSHSVMDIVRAHLLENVSKNLLDFSLIKKMYRDVKFNYELAFRSMLDAGYSEKTARESINNMLDKFEQLKETDQLFKMKQFIPRELRNGFYDFLEFASDGERDLYMSLQGVNVLVYDDLYTSGATVKDAIRCLNSINNKNKITVFVLVKQ